MGLSVDIIEAVCKLAFAGIAVVASVVVAIVVVVDNRSEVACNWASVAIAVVVAEIADFADLGLVVVASYSPFATKSSNEAHAHECYNVKEAS